jgi:hypothetical protein
MIEKDHSLILSGLSRMRKTNPLRACARAGEAIDCPGRYYQTDNSGCYYETDSSSRHHRTAGQSRTIPPLLILLILLYARRICTIVEQYHIFLFAHIAQSFYVLKIMMMCSKKRKKGSND